MALAGEKGEGQERGGERGVHDGVMSREVTVGGTGEIQAGRVIHRADVPKNGEQGFKDFAGAGDDAGG